MIIVHIISVLIILWLCFALLWWVWDKFIWWIRVGRYENKRLSVIILETVLQIFIMFSLYTPLFWYITHLRKTYWSINFFNLRLSEMVVYGVFVITPLIAMLYLFAKINSKNTD